MDRLKELTALLNEAARAYYSTGTQIMSDKRYDELYDELVALEEKLGTVLADSPTQRVGYEVLGELKKVRHPKRMLSLNKTKVIAELEAFAGSNKAILSFKMDGLTVVLTYKEGELVQAVTRGNGEIGEDITHNAKVFKNLPLHIPFKGELTLRGEAVISFEDFDRINSGLPDGELYKNPRNLCAGSVRQLDSAVCARRNVCFIAFGLVSAQDKTFSKKSEQFDFLESLGFACVKRRLVDSQSMEEAVLDFEREIPQNRFATDGLVLTFNDIAYSESLGETAKFPRDSIAFKWADETAQTILRKIEWSTSRTGLINPIAVFDPVELEGTTVARASLHNLSIIKELELGVGDTISVYKANMIIPQVAESLTKGNNIVPPDTCPVCGGKTEKVGIKDGEFLKCTNPNCKAQRVLLMSHYASRDAMNIEGLSENTVERFVNEGLLDVYPDIYTLYEHEDKITELEGFGKRSFDNLVSAIKTSQNTELSRFIYALGIENVGVGGARVLCRAFGNSLEKIMNATEEELVAVRDIGLTTARAVIDYFSDETNRELIKKAVAYLTFAEAEEVTESEISGKTFVITGSVNHFKNRKEMQAEIEKRGGNVTSSVSSKTDFLVNNDVTSASAKNKKAKELNIPIINEEELLGMLGS